MLKIFTYLLSILFCVFTYSYSELNHIHHAEFDEEFAYSSYEWSLLGIEPNTCDTNIDPAPRTYFIQKFISLAQVVPGLV